MKIKIHWVLPLLLFITACTAVPTTAQPPTLTVASTPIPTEAATASLTVPSPTATAALLPEVSFTKGPYLVQGADVTSMNILWQDPIAANYWLEYGFDTTYASGKVLPTGVTADGLAKVTLTDLPPGKHYVYRVTDGSSQAAGSFNTSPVSTTDLTFWVYGDSRDCPAVQDAIDADILADIQSNPAAKSFVLFSGDIMAVAEEASLQSNQFDPAYPSIREMMRSLPMINAMGNHDGTKLFTRYFPYPFKGNFYWSFDYGPVHVALVDQYADVSDASPQWQWLREDLAASTQPWKFILLHEPGWSAGTHPNNEIVQKVIQPIAAKTGVSVIFAGHNHYYARAEVNGVIHITTGGGGAPLYTPISSSQDVKIVKKAFHYLKVSIIGNTLTATALTPDNQPIDEFTINH